MELFFSDILRFGAVLRGGGYSFCSQLASAETSRDEMRRLSSPVCFGFCLFAMGLTLIQLVTLPHCSLSIWITGPGEPKNKVRQRERERGLGGLEQSILCMGLGDESGLDDRAGGEDDARLLADAVVSNEAVRSVSTDQ